ncbi:MAG TPA: hypothetical protein VG146_01795 [Verrucomicrobiae bacterium]|nr:hypothetical protein [Verrucomicrobiae bacterium]
MIETAIPAPAAPAINAPAVQAAAKDLVDTATLVKSILTAYKQGGAAAAAGQLPAAVSQIATDIKDAEAALPSIKSGYATTEFWLTAGVVVLNGVYPLVTGKQLPFDANIVMGAAVAIYTAARGLQNQSRMKRLCFLTGLCLLLSGCKVVERIATAPLGLAMGVYWGAHDRSPGVERPPNTNSFSALPH